MTTFLPKDIQEDLDQARLAVLKKTSRLRVAVDGATFPVLRMWQGGFAVEAAEMPRLRGLVDLYDGTHHLSQCLIIASEEDAGEMRYEYKWEREALDRAPLDFARAPEAPVALIGKG